MCLFVGPVENVGMFSHDFLILKNIIFSRDS